MARPCTTCAHPEREEIDRLLVDGTPATEIAQRFGLGARSVRRHAANHLPATLAKAEAANEVAHAGDLLAQLQDLQARTMGILDTAEEAHALGVALAAIREARGCIKLLAQLLGELDSQPQINVLVSPQWIQVRAVLLDALTPYAEARAAAARALLEVADGHR